MAPIFPLYDVTPLILPQTAAQVIPIPSNSIPEKEKNINQVWVDKALFKQPRTCTVHDIRNI